MEAWGRRRHDMIKVGDTLDIIVLSDHTVGLVYH